MLRLSSGLLLLAALLLSAPQARADQFRYILGDEPYWSGEDSGRAAIAAGCYKWNWQQYGWYNVCPVYLHPKAFRYSWLHR